MALGPIKDWRFATSDTAPARVNKLEAARSAILSLLSVNEGGLKGRLSDVLQNPGFWLPENVPALTQGSLVPVEGEGEVLQTQGAIALAPHAWEKVEGGRYYEGFWRFRVVKNDPLGEAVAPETGFFIYDAYGSYIGAHGTTTRATVTVASGWQDYFDTTTGAAIKTQYPAAAYVRPALMRGDEGVAISQVSRFRITDVTDITLLANDVTLRFIEERNLWQDADTAIYTEISGIELSMGEAIASITEEIELLVSADEAMATQIITISAAIDDVEASITTTSEALATLEGAFADYTVEVDASIGDLESTVSIHASALTTLEGYAEARLELVAVAGDGKAELTLYADANGGGGVRIVGDVEIDGDLLVTGSVNHQQLNVSDLVKRAEATGSGSPAAGTTTLLASASMGTAYPDGSYQMEIIGGFQTNVGRETDTYLGLPFYTDYLPDGGLLIQIKKGSDVMLEYEYAAAEFASEVYGTRTLAVNTVQLSDPSDPTTGSLTLEIYAIHGNADTGVIDEGDYYARQLSATYSSFSCYAKAKWTFI